MIIFPPQSKQLGRLTSSKWFVDAWSWSQSNQNTWSLLFPGSLLWIPEVRKAEGKAGVECAMCWTKTTIEMWFFFFKSALTICVLSVWPSLSGVFIIWSVQLCQTEIQAKPSMSNVCHFLVFYREQATLSLNSQVAGNVIKRGLGGSWVAGSGLLLSLLRKGAGRQLNWSSSISSSVPANFWF